MNEFVKVPNTTLPFREWVINYLNKTSIEKYDTKPSKEQMEMIKSLWEATMEEDVRRNDTYTVYIDWDSGEHGGITPNEKMKVVHLSIKDWIEI